MEFDMRKWSYIRATILNQYWSAQYLGPLEQDK